MSLNLIPTPTSTLTLTTLTLTPPIVTNPSSPSPFTLAFTLAQVAVLAGDYLLARASVLLAKLECVNVVQIMASALDSLVQGEIMQIKSAPEDTLEMVG